jgi:hypothetical protein
MPKLASGMLRVGRMAKYYAQAESGGKTQRCN